MDLPDEDVACLNKAKALAQNENLELQLLKLSADFGFLPPLMTKMETKGLHISDGIAAVEEVRQRLSQVRGELGKALCTYFSGRLQANPGYTKIFEISKVISGTINMSDRPSCIHDLSASQIMAFSYANLTSMDSERSFSCWKSIFDERRTNFTVGNIEMVAVVNYYHRCTSG